MKKELVPYLKSLRNQIITAFELLEPKHKFERKNWEHHGGGGGEISVLRGEVFEKAAVNWSGVYGEKLPFGDAEGPFFATGISLITHMKNPHAPTVHMNIRFIETKEKCWFGGGYDLTPMGITYPEDADHFHDIAKKTLHPFGNDYYEMFSQNAKEYFFIPHWKKERGVGGIFFDYFNTGNLERDKQLWQSVGNTFLDAIIPIYQRRIHLPYGEEEKSLQLKMRGHYVEFNLLYDRGTKFGIHSGGNPEAIFCSLPPQAAW